MKKRQETPEQEQPSHVQPVEETVIGPTKSVAADEALAEIERLRAREDELLRALAEQQNVNRRRRQEMDTAVVYAQEELLRDLLPVLDDFERALKAMEGAADESIVSGVAMVQDRLVRTLARHGVTPIRPHGARFDPSLHEAVAERSGTDAAPGTVVEVVQPGYWFRDRVLRHAKVIVAGPSNPAGDSRAQEETR